MGIHLSNLRNWVIESFLSPQEYSIVMIGLDAAGKTTILYNLKLGEVVTTIPTIGFNVESVEVRNLKLVVWDVGGQDFIRPLWNHYFSGSQAVIFVVDSQDDERMELARKELLKIHSDDQLRDAALLVFANKQDLPNALSVEEVASRIGLKSFRSRDWHIQGTCAINQQGLYEGLDWLCSALKRKK